MMTLKKVKSTHLLDGDLMDSVKILAIRKKTNVTAIISELLEKFVKDNKDLL